MSNKKLLRAIHEEMEKRSMMFIKVSEYDSLVEKARFLDALIGAGVDNWDGYDYAVEIMENE